MYVPTTYKKTLKTKQILKTSIVQSLTKNTSKLGQLSALTRATTPAHFKLKF